MYTRLRVPKITHTRLAAWKSGLRLQRRRYSTRCSALSQLLPTTTGTLAGPMRLSDLVSVSMAVNIATEVAQLQLSRA